MYLETTDQMGRSVRLKSPPERIISLVPSQTEFLVDIGTPLIGRTKFCIHPKEKIKQITIIGGTKKFRFETIRELQPDLVIGNKEENYEEGIGELEKHFPVWMSDIYTLEDSFGMMQEIGKLCGKEKETQSVISDCRSALNKVKNTCTGSVVYLIWKDPWMAAGTHTFIDDMLQHLGHENVITDERYPELTEEAIPELNPDHILLSSEPYPFREKHLDTVRRKWPGAQVQLVDGELYSWYGSRMKKWKTTNQLVLHQCLNDG